MNLEGPNVIKGVEVPAATRSGSVGLDVRLAPSNSSLQSSSAALLSLGMRRSMWLDLDAGEANIFRTWQVPSFLTMTVPPTWDTVSSRFACVVNGNKVLLWDGEETKLDKVEPALVLKGAEISDILQQGPGEDLLVVFADGSVQSLKHLERHGKSTTASNLSGAELKKTMLLRRKNQQPCLVHMLKSKKTSDLELLVFGMFVDPDSGQLETTQLERCSVSKGERLLGVVQVAEGPAVVVMTSTHHIQCRHLLAKNQGGEASQRRIDGLPKFAGKEEIVVASIDEEYGVLAVSTKLHLINFRFYSTIFSLDLENQLISLAVLNDKIFFATNEGVQLVSAVNLPRSLDGLLGLLGGKSSESKDSPTKSKTETMTAVNAVSFSAKLYTTVPNMLRSKNLNGIEKLLLSDKAAEIPELLLLAIIEYLLKCPDTTLAQCSLTKHDDSPQVRRERLLRACLSAPMTEPLMIQYATRLDSALAIQILEHIDLSLRILLLTRGNDGGEDFFSRLLSWLAVLLNTHYGSIVIAKDNKVAELMASLTDTIGTCAENLSFDMIQLMPLVKLMQEGKLNSNDSKLMSRRDYCIEVVNL